MTEKNLVINNLELRYKGVFDLKEFYHSLGQLAEEKGYRRHEKKFEETNKTGSKDTFIEFRFLKEKTYYFELMIKIRLQIKNMKEISKAIDEANSIYGKHSLHLASSDVLNRFKQHLGDRGDFSLRKTTPLKGENFRQHIHIPVWNVKV